MWGKVCPLRRNPGVQLLPIRPSFVLHRSINRAVSCVNRLPYRLLVPSLHDVFGQGTQHLAGNTIGQGRQCLLAFPGVGSCLRKGGLDGPRGANGLYRRSQVCFVPLPGQHRLDGGVVLYLLQAAEDRQGDQALAKVAGR